TSLGLNDPVIVQFWHYITRLLHGNFGISYYNQVSVFQLIMERLPATLELVFVSVVMAMAIGFPLGVWSAISRNKSLKEGVQILSLIGVSLPWFLTGIILIIVFSVWLGWFPSSTGFLTASGWHSIVLPALSLGLSMVTIIMRLIRTEMLEVMKSDYVKFARARGIENYRIWFRHALKNALLPVVTVIGLQIGGLIAFAIVIETVFQWPGMGLLLIQSINFVDVPVLSGYLLFTALIFIVINTLVDLLYYLIDPRMRAQ
ncbi:ABC transporter permease, partial [Pantoea sp. CTOTU46764]|uniref:ABC transporter permease n=1 Tax=Pantoea sp. CTOTU46764 TaxID=2953854 RepID=UPI00289E27F3